MSSIYQRLRDFIAKHLLRGISRTQLRNIGISALLLLMALSGIMYILARKLAGDNPVQLEASRENLRQLRYALRAFQSELYFVRAPKNLAELPEIINTPPTVMMPTATTIEAVKVKITPPFETVNIFRSPTNLDKKTTDEFTTDYVLPTNYTAFLPDNAIILMDKAGNFRTGGNVIFNDGKTFFLPLSPAEYLRFVNAIYTQSDRDFVRQKCANCSIAGFASEAIIVDDKKALQR